VTRALAFLAGLLAIHVALSLGFARTVGAAHDATQMDARWSAARGPVMIAGDSHARFGVESRGGLVTVAVPGEHYGKSRFRVPALLDRRPARAVVLPYDAVSFSSFKAERYDPEHVWGRYVDFGQLAIEQQAPLRYGGMALKARLAPWVGELDTVVEYLRGTRHFRGREGVGGRLAVRERPAEVAARHFEGAEPFDPRMVHALRSLLAELRRRGVRVVLVRFPVSPRYRAAAAALGARSSQRDALLAELLTPGQVDHLDLERLFDARPGAFLDADHLGPRGRRALTRRLRRELATLGALGRDEPAPNEP